MKKILVFVAIFALLLPAAAFAAAEFSLGGFIKLDSFWDSTQNGKNMNEPVQRNNDGSFHHGNMRFTAQGSRFNFTIKGPKVFGAQTTGFLEIDFDSTTNQNASASNSYVPRLRHAMFRLNWPETELLFGQYWSLFSSWYSESVQDGPFQVTACPTARLPQIRFTQKFLMDWTAIGLIGQANNDTGFFSGNPYNASTNDGGDAETPQAQASLKYEHDWWGKAAYYGHPIPFTAQIMGGWQRNVARTQNVTGTSISQQAVAGRITSTYQSPWCAMGTLFIPVIPTHSANLAGTASILAQFHIGQGVNAFGFTTDGTNVLQLVQNTPFAGAGTNTQLFDINLIKTWGGMVQGQYYFDNQWYANVAWAIAKTYDVKQGSIVNNRPEFYYSNVNGQLGTMNEVNATVWYRPVQALKFGLQYAFVQTNWLTSTGVATAQNGGTYDRTNIGTEHRVEFVGYFFF